MTRKHTIAIAKVIRDTTAITDPDGLSRFVEEMADELSKPGMAKNFDRDLFIAYATSISPEE